MRAAFYDRLGQAEDVLQVGDLPDPLPQPGEVLVKVAASGINPSDVKSRAGGAVHPFPRVVPHSDGAGVISAVGEGVHANRIGQRVWLWNAQWQRPWGTAAELVAVPEAQAVPLPGTVSFEAGACLGVPFLTAWRAVHYQPIEPGEVVLVAGGAGAVGYYAIQLAKRAGARVIATVSSAEKASIASAAGADLVLDYNDPAFEAALKRFTGWKGADRIVEVDLVGNAPRYRFILRKGGLVVAYGSRSWSAALPLSEWLLHGIELAIFIVYELPDEVRRVAVAQSAAILDDPSFRHLIARTFSLDQIAAAHQAVEHGRLLGNAVVLID
ncbi:NADPH2:quinone reductase [Sphingomonas guangdongensis]|uniref:NADPH2:quinone reductase n=1 Tax=Sphingomonas guangdongensis TaxID=1141890 RepID=A0A285R428_9SPHN|nr:NADPH:quinone reductase [Sphingomonas guangdongensis]SOB87107.1 NADPH2:quinone reductase [Sphingomonas guangdongensis]